MMNLGALPHLPLLPLNNEFTFFREYGSARCWTLDLLVYCHFGQFIALDAGWRQSRGRKYKGLQRKSLP